MLVYVVLAHKNLPQVGRLMDVLGGSSCERILHIDAATDLRPSARLLSDLELSGVRMAPRHRCPWGAFGLVAATLDCMRMALREVPPLSHLVVLSGQDYPLTPPATIADFYAHQAGRSFMENRALPRSDWPGGGMERIADLHLHAGRHRIGLPLSRLGLTRRLPGGRVPYQGGQTWSMSADAVALVAETTRAEPELERFFRRTAHPDESFFQTILMNSPLATTVIDRDMRYEDWTRGGPHPAVLTRECFGALAASGAHFAKKFDASIDSAVLDLIDEELLRRPAPAQTS